VRVLIVTGGQTCAHPGSFGGAGSGNVRLASGTINVAPTGATFDFASGLFEWTGGEIAGTGTLTNSNTINVGGGDKSLGGLLSNTDRKSVVEGKSVDHRGE